MGSDAPGVVFFHDREEIEDYAAALEALAQSLYAPNIRNGDKFLDTTMSIMANLEAFARELILEANEQDQEAPQCGQMPLDRDAVRFLCYGVLHTFKAFKDGQEETVDGETPQRTLAGVYSAFWWLTDRFESERRQEVYDRLERFDRFQRSLERQFGERSDADLEEVAVARRSLSSLVEPLTGAITGIMERPEANHTHLLRLLKDQGRRLLTFIERAPRNPSSVNGEQMLVPMYRLRHLGELLQDGTQRESAVALQEAADLLRDVLTPESGR